MSSPRCKTTTNYQPGEREGSAMAKMRRSESGAAIVEFALVLPILVMLVFGIVSFARAYYVKSALQAGVREGARELALRHSSSAVDAAVRAAAPSLSIDTITQGAACPAAGDARATVTATDVFIFEIPFVSFGSISLSATAVMRCGL
jgi:Flp pilus assembly protein TadG